ncbi:hypothetical protein ALI22I_13600 [Saccharothrix sp. ALI-22-I]|uniref:helix-turn-helix transcriptional regulator n=1 Tax=Saccharothrix sp. ALI-22-I TaxID=1933778 RepID=UPI0009D2C525|nr:helix-turn-helix domain-containing protein [Saccharothrix sp. ALI-22-I]ONI89956.1 hypothetical protein ALI22I_13600 [Saccharothrix sp. ALI-22-I]
MSIRVMTWVWEHAEVAGTDLLLLLAIADAADDQGRNAWPSVADLSRKTRLDERTVQRRLKRLHSQGHITIEPGGGRRRNRYTIPMAAAPRITAGTTPTGPPQCAGRPPNNTSCLSSRSDAATGSPSRPCRLARVVRALRRPHATGTLCRRRLRHARAVPPLPSQGPRPEPR